MDDARRLFIENECRKLTILNCQHMDRLEPEAFANIDSEDTSYKPVAERPPSSGGRRFSSGLTGIPRTGWAGTAP